MPLWTAGLLGYYLREWPPITAGAIIQRLSQGPAGPLKEELGWLATRLGAAHHPLKACPACIGDDVREHGLPAWRLVHQAPGVWLCPMHDESLWTTNKKTSLHRLPWVLPDDIPTFERKVVIQHDLPPQPQGDSPAQSPKALKLGWRQCKRRIAGCRPNDASSTTPCSESVNTSSLPLVGRAVNPHERTANCGARRDKPRASAFRLHPCKTGSHPCGFRLVVLPVFFASVEGVMCFQRAHKDGCTPVSDSRSTANTDAWR